MKQKMLYMHHFRVIKKQRWRASRSCLPCGSKEAERLQRGSDSATDPEDRQQLRRQQAGQDTQGKRHLTVYSFIIMSE